MSNTSRLARASVAVSLAFTAVALLGGCSWFGKGAKGDYALAVEARPLEVPPDLNLPDTSGAMALPPAAGPTQSAAPAAPAASATAFTVQGDHADVFARVGTVLEGLDGLEIASRSQLLGTYDVSYQGANFLVRVADMANGIYVGAMDPRGVAAAGEPPKQVIAALQAALAAR